MDYRELLIKYMYIVICNEGTVFLSDAQEPEFTKEEIQELKKIAKEAEKR